MGFDFTFLNQKYGDLNRVWVRDVESNLRRKEKASMKFYVVNGVVIRDKKEALETKQESKGSR